MLCPSRGSHRYQKKCRPYNDGHLRIPHGPYAVFLVSLVFIAGSSRVMLPWLRHSPSSCAMISFNGLLRQPRHFRPSRMPSLTLRFWLYLISAFHLWSRRCFRLWDGGSSDTRRPSHFFFLANNFVRSFWTRSHMFMSLPLSWPP